MMLLFAIPLLVVIRTFSLWSENYERLPEKIPMHFNLSGTADRFWKKSRFAAFFIPVTSLGTVGIVFVSFFAAPAAAGEFWDEMAASGLLMCLAIAWMFHRISAGMIDYSKGAVKSINPYIKLPIALVLLASATTLLPVVAPHKIELKSLTVCTGIKGCPASPVGEANGFSARSEKIYAVARWEFLNGRHEVITRWVAPDGSELFRYKFKLSGGKIRKNRTTYAWISPAYFGARMRPGRWSVQVLLNGKTAARKHFSIY